MLIINAFWGYLKRFKVSTILWRYCYYLAQSFSKSMQNSMTDQMGLETINFTKIHWNYEKRRRRGSFFTSNCHCWILPINLLTSRLKNPALRCPSLIVGFLKTMNTYARILGGLIFFHEEKMFKCHAKCFFFFWKTHTWLNEPDPS